ncbi:MAG: hypothetical protein WA996_02030, partial [Candidatus Promineifilaceae bacterium]
MALGRLRNGHQPLGLICLLAIGLILCNVNSANANGADLAVRIARPGEGETYYASPTALVYSVPVTGWVDFVSTNPAEIEVRLDVLQGQRLVGSSTTSPSEEGFFRFLATPNPDGSSEVFGPER